MATASVTNTFVNGTPANAGDVNQNFADLVAFVNNHVLHRDGTLSMQGTLDVGSNRISNVANPTAAADAAPRDWVRDEIDSRVAGAISDGSITTAKLADGAVTTAKIANTTVTDAKIASNAVTSAKIASNAVTNAKIASGAVGAAEIASNAVTSAKIASDAVTSAKIASNAVTSAKIASNAVTSAKIASGAVGESELDSGSTFGGDVGSSWSSGIRIRRIGNTVWVSGTATRTAPNTTSLSTVATIPSGFRPSAQPGDQTGTTSQGNIRTQRITTGGNIQVNGANDGEAVTFNFMYQV